ncbi:fungal-specific transcription factor domain-containing protein [Mycena crocata]|nr:fungal-specific transcription factor domain-containing protein [Mycena crocata]
MSSNEDEYGQEYHRGKKRRIQRACDVCRRRKSRCDGSQMPGDKCSTCLDSKLDCTYLEAAMKRAPAKNTYVESLEARLEHSDALIRQLRAELATAHFNNSEKAAAAAASADGQTNDNSGPKPIDGHTSTLHILRTALRSLSAPPPPPHADDLVHLEIQRKLEKLSVGAPPERRFIGKSSGAALVKAAIDLKADVKRGERRGMNSSDGDSPRSHASAEQRHASGSGSHASPSCDYGVHADEDRDAAVDDDAGSGSDSDDEQGNAGLTWTSRRLQYWTFKPWENTIPRTHEYSFPPAALMGDLISLYFAHVNMYLPLLHQPTFERGVATGLHFREDGFAATVLLVCAVGSRYSTDPRVMTPGGTEGVGPYKADKGNLACGWVWFDQVPLVGKHLFGQATLYDLQYYCLAVQFLEGSSAPQACWTLIGVGLRLAQDVGAHRRTMRVEQPTVERELWKRAFWVLVYMDRTVSSGMGRPCAVQYDDFDLDPPVECDDEYWEHPTRPFQQPPGVPSRVAFFNALIRLNHILAFSLKILYSLSKVRAVFQIDDTWEENVVAELDSALNSWRDQVPEHLRWDPLREDPTFFDQSVALHTGYYHLQILIHRPFIPMVRKSAPTALPSLAICTSAARACANMVDMQRQRKGKEPVVINLPAVFTSGIVLLLNVWSGKRTGLVPDSGREIANVHKCMEVVRLCEDRWQSAGLLWDILAELASVGQLPLPNYGNPAMVNEYVYQQDQIMAAQIEHTAPPLPPGTRYPRCQTEPLSPEIAGRIMLGSRGLRQTFDRPIGDPQFRAPYTPVPVASFAGLGGNPGTLGPAPMEPSAFAPTPAADEWFPPEDPFADIRADPAQASRELDGMMSLIDSDTIAMWTNAPMGYEVDDWGNYFSNFSEITQGQQMMMNGDMGMNGN